MNANKRRMSKGRTWGRAACVLSAVAVFGGAPMSARAAERTAVPNVTESLFVIRQNAPGVARAIAADKELRSVVGPDKWALALHRVAEFSKKTDADHKDALHIIGDTVTRVKSPVGTIKLDGDPSEWSESMPGAESVRAPQGPTADLWKSGAAAVVRQDRLYLMVGLGDAAQYFAQPGNELRMTIDCKDDQAWDVFLSISTDKGVWAVRQMPGGFRGRLVKALPAPQASIGAVAEIAIAIRDFVPLTEAKPIWTLQMEAMGRKGKNREGELTYLATHEFSIFNENAREGVAAWPYVRTFLCLCADKPLDDFELTAAAIAIMSSSMYAGGDEEVHKKIRVDNAEFLEVARELDAWQTKTGTNYRLKNYPLEAQLAWASRIQSGLQHRRGVEEDFVEVDRGPGRKHDLEYYYWVSTSVDTLQKLKTVAIQEGRTDASLAQCGERIDRWVLDKEEGSYAPSAYAKIAGRATDPDKADRNKEKEARAKELQANADTVGYYRGKPVSEFRLNHSESMLRRIEANGHFIGSCGQHTHLCRDVLRALGIAPLTFSVNAKKLIGHAWPAWYDPSQNLWLSYQNGRKDKNRWFFCLGRPPVFSYATEAEKLAIGKSNTGPSPFPLVFCRELQGHEVAKLSHTGIPTKEVREWMLTPGF